MKTILKSLYFYFKYKVQIKLNCNVSKNSSFAKEVCVGDRVTLSDVSVGDFSYIGNNVCCFNADIGKYVSIGPNVSIGENEHFINKITTSNALLTYKQRKEYEIYNSRRCVIGHDVWIGRNVFVKKGVNIGNGAVVAAGAVVTKNVSEYSVVGGVPAKIIKMRFNEEKISYLKSLQWWNFEAEELANFLKLQE